MKGLLIRNARSTRRGGIRARMFAVFALASAAFAAMVLAVMPRAADFVVDSMMESHAKTIVGLERRMIETMVADSGSPLFQEALPAKAVRDELRALVEERSVIDAFGIDAIFIVSGASTSTVYARPGSPATPPDAKLVAQAQWSGEVSLHRMDRDMARRMGGVIDVVASLRIPSDQGSSLVLRLDFGQSYAKHMSRYTTFEMLVVGLSLVAEFAQAFILLGFVRRYAIEPAVRISKAMDAVAGGNLRTQVEIGGSDEFGNMASHFNQMVLSLREREGLATYVSRQTLAAVAEGAPEAWRTPVRKDLVLLFSDVRGFTSFAERNAPELVIERLNRLLSAQAAAIVEAGGEIDKFIGDAVMATFREARPALLCALKIQRLLDGSGDGLRVGIGIAAGSVVEGDVGSRSFRDFTVIGDAVNTAARLESLARPGEILVVEDLLVLPAMKPFRWERRGTLRLKGKGTPVRVASVVGVQSRAET